MRFEHLSIVTTDKKPGARFVGFYQAADGAVVEFIQAKDA